MEEGVHELREAWVPKCTADDGTHRGGVEVVGVAVDHAVAVREAFEVKGGGDGDGGEGTPEERLAGDVPELLK